MALPSRTAARGRRPLHGCHVLVALLLAWPAAHAVVPDWRNLPQGAALVEPDGRAWALALAGPYVHVLNGTPYELGEYSRAVAARKAYREMLRNSWGVKTREELLQQLAMLQAGAMHAEYAELLARDRATDTRTWLWRHTLMLTSSRDWHRVRLVEREAPKLGAAGILAYDISRYVNLVRWGYQVGFFSDGETWALIVPAARAAQANFDSWQAFGHSFLVGREFWGGESVADDQPLFVRAVRDLLEQPQGEWHLIPWSRALQATPIRGADPEAGD